MSLDTYANLKLEIIDWSHRDDLDLKIDTFIDMAESEMFSNAIEPLKSRNEEARTSFSTSTSNRFVALPTGFQSARKLRIQITDGESITLTYRTPNALNLYSNAGLPLFYTVTDQIEMDRTSDQVYTGEIQYYKRFTALSSGNTTNAVLTNYPNIYLYGALWALKNHVDLPNEAQYYYNLFIQAIKGANKEQERGIGAAPQMKVDRRTP